jgi:hypothetical protein
VNVIRCHEHQDWRSAVVPKLSVKSGYLYRLNPHLFEIDKRGILSAQDTV